VVPGLAVLKELDSRLKIAGMTVGVEFESLTPHEIPNSEVSKETSVTMHQEMLNSAVGNPFPTELNASGRDS